MVVTLAKAPNEIGGVINIECPVDALYIPRQCVPCKKKAHVSWNFCPWCGKRLAK